jgi:hypothetical protein
VDIRSIAEMSVAKKGCVFLRTQQKSVTVHEGYKSLIFEPFCRFL